MPEPRESRRPVDAPIVIVACVIIALLAPSIDYLAHRELWAALGCAVLAAWVGMWMLWLRAHIIPSGEQRRQETE